MNLPELDASAIRSEYERRFSRDPGQVGSAEPFLRFVARYLPDAPEARLLDAGCGFGRYARALVDQGYSNVDGVDLFEQIPEGGFAYSQGDLTALPYPDHAFDFALCHSVIYYLPEPRTGIAELARVLRPGGRLVLTGHTQLSLATWIRRIKRPLGKASHLLGVRFHGTGSYERWLRESGFDLIWRDGFSAKRIGKLLDQLGLPLARLRSHFAYHFALVADRRRT